MTRINLLPFRAARKKENVRRQISVFVLSVIFLSLATGYGWLQYGNKLEAAQEDKAKKEKTLKSYADTNRKIKELQNSIEAIKKKLGVIRNLEKSKTGPVRLLDDIATAVPAGKLWLESLTEKEGKLSLKGVAADNDTVALFMENLKKTSRIKEVDLMSAMRKEMAQYDLTVTDFVLSCMTTLEKKKEPVKKKKRSKRKKRRKKK